MIKQALEYLVGLKPVELIDVDGRTYSTDRLHQVLDPFTPGFDTSTLTSIVDYLRADPDNRDGKYILLIHSPEKVSLMSSVFGRFEQRDELITSTAFLPSFQFGRFVGKEQFIIELQSKFTKFLDEDGGNLIETDGDKGILQKFIGALKSEYVKNHNDDGVSQKVEVKTGITTVGEAIVPNPVTLAPFRSFPEINQVESEFIFRMREGMEGIEMALFEADGGAWRLEAIQRIKKFFEEKFKEHDITEVTILA